MKFCLIGEAHTRPFHVRNLVQIFGIETELIREASVFLKLLSVRVRVVLDRRMEIIPGRE